MEIILAPHAGFCFGVEKAVNMVYDELHTGEKISTYGPIIHNEEVVRDLESNSVTTTTPTVKTRRSCRRRTPS